MDQLTGITLFSGIGGAAYGMKKAGIRMIASVEYDEENSKYSDYCKRVSSINFPDCHFYKAKVEEVAAYLPRCDVLQASPVCSNLSVANHMRSYVASKQKGKETRRDHVMAKGIVTAIRSTCPTYFWLEQVPAYLKSDSFGIIKNFLDAAGYEMKIKVIDAADYGVPQNRKRLILLASKNGLWDFPSERLRMGWKEAIAGIELMPGKLSERQILTLINKTKKGIEYDMKKGILVQNDGLSPTIRRYDQPIWTLTRNTFKDRETSAVGTIVDDEGLWYIPVKGIARLCGFPDDFYIESRYGGQGLGYAVPPLLAQVLTQKLTRNISHVF
jgi:DNA (cytosine-5)-methyltransferase 1